MIVTETEAFEKWCPFARADITARERVEDGKPGPNSSRCIGSRCMAWRAAEPRIEFAEGSPFSVARGFCGLAGKATP